MYFVKLVANSYVKKLFLGKQSEILPTTYNKSDQKQIETRLEMENSHSNLGQRSSSSRHNGKLWHMLDSSELCLMQC